MGLVLGIIGIAFYFALIQLLGEGCFTLSGTTALVREELQAQELRLRAYILRKKKEGFTLVELSIVLVVIGLLVTGILTAQQMIKSAEVQATITEVEQFQTAATTFRERTGYLPGDIPDPTASSFGFAARGTYAGEGDGNGTIEGNFSNTAGGNIGTGACAGENLMFWKDLSAAKMIQGGFTVASPTNCGVDYNSVVYPTGPHSIGAVLPAAKLGYGNYV